MKHQNSPESLMMSYGYDAMDNQGAVKSPLYLTSTFEFTSAEEGKAWFEQAYGLNDSSAAGTPGMIYSRLNNPNVDLFEKRLALWDKAGASAGFASGMAAISTVMMEMLKPGNLLLYSNPVYGGTHHFINHILPKWGVEALPFGAGETFNEIAEKILAAGGEGRVAMVYVETPANPTNALFDLDICRQLADTFAPAGQPPLLAVDNTYMGPVWQSPLEHGADLVLCSATKYIGGHSDLIAGAVSGSAEMIGRLKGLRTFMGNMMSPHTAWMLTRSLETVKLRMDKQAENAEKIAAFLASHPAVEKIYYAGRPGTPRDRAVFKKQCLGKGAMLSFELEGGETAAFAFLNNLHLIKLAVSLGGTESLAEHPYTMTHADVPAAEKEAIGIKKNMVRLSVGVENVDDILHDLSMALEKSSLRKKNRPKPEAVVS